MDYAGILTDYGGVLSSPQTKADLRSLAGLAEMDVDQFRQAYWRHRPAYDRGQVSSEEYWNRVTGRHVPSAVEEKLSAVDIEGWTRPNALVLPIYQRLGPTQLSLLSNAPKGLAGAIPGLPWMPPVSRMIFSCDLGLAKPDRAIYLEAANILGLPMPHVLLVDDREENITGARRAGMSAYLYESPTNLEAHLGSVGFLVT